MSEYEEFFKAYGGSCRTKWLAQPDGASRRILNAVGRLVHKSPKRDRKNRVTYRLPSQSRLPREFIRLEPWEMEYLYALASHAARGILEIGRLQGGSTFVMAHANPGVPIFSIDIGPQDDARLQQYFQGNGVGENVRLITGDSQTRRYEEVTEIDLLFIDGDHSYQGCTNDLENWYGAVVPGGHILLHDSYFGCEVQPAVIDFIARHNVQIIQPPYIGATHWRYPCGSLAHLRKAI
jgi:predicted O-methyltransferase YrrM